MNTEDEALLDAIHEALAEAARSGFTFARVAERSSFSEEELRERFGTTSNLYFSLVVDSFRAMSDEVGAAVTAADTGPESLDAFIRSTLRHFGPRVRTLRSILWPQCVGAEVLGFTVEEMQTRWYPVAVGPLDPLAKALEREWGQDLPTGVHPRRHAWVCNLAIIGQLVMTSFAEATGDPAIHSEEDMIDEMARVTAAPLAILKQLAALNIVATELAGFRQERELHAALPRLLASSLGLESAGALIATEGEQELTTSDSTTMTRIADVSLLPGPLTECMRTGELRFEVEGEPAEGEPVRLEPPWVAAPFHVGDSLLGVLFAQTSGRFAIDRGFLSRVETFATMAGMALANVRHLENLQSEVDARTRELRDAQASLVRAAKLASLGQLVAGVSHELNTPLGALQSAGSSLGRAVEMLEEEHATASTTPSRKLQVIKSSSETMSSAADRVGSVVRRLKRFARLDEADVQLCDVHECVDDSVAILEISMPAGVEIQKRYGDVPKMLVRPRELNDLFFNLVLNAVQASGSEGRIEIRTRATETDLVVEIEDRGAGIAPADLSRVFDPGFTTRGVRVGAGLGLATCHQIVGAHEGTIEVESELDRGTTVTVTVPLAGRSSTSS